MFKEKKRRKQCGGKEAKQNESGNRKNDLPMVLARVPEIGSLATK
jgi:hypothetical protein